MGEILTVEDIRRSSWREDLEEKQAYESRRREIEEERERKARAAAEKQQPAPSHGLDELVAVIDERVRGWFDYYFDDELSEGNDRRGCYFEMIAEGLAGIRQRACDDFGRALGELREEFEAKFTALEQHLASNNPAAWASWVDGRIEA